MPRATFSGLLLLIGCASAFSQQPPRTNLPAAEGNTTGSLRQIIPGH